MVTPRNAIAFLVTPHIFKEKTNEQMRHWGFILVFFKSFLQLAYKAQVFLNL